MTALLYWKGSGDESLFDPDVLALVGLNMLGILLFLYGFARSGILLVRQARERQGAA